MFEAAHKTLPALDYVSMIRSLYADPHVMMLGALSSALAAAAAGLEAQNAPMLVIAGAFVLLGMIRAIDMRAFATAGLAENDVEAARRWEIRATVGAASIAALYGIWSSYSFLVVSTPFAEMSSLAVSVSVLVGVAGRNFAIDRLVSIQVLLIGVPLFIGMLFDGGLHTMLFSIVLLGFFVSLRKVAANIRAILIKVVHSRIEARRLADELDTALETMQHGLCMLDENGLMTVANDRALQTFAGLASGAWVGRPFSELLELAATVGQLPRTAADRLQDIVNQRGGGKVLLCLPNSQYFEVTVSSRQGRTVLLFEDISERIKAEERINFMARYDALTGLPNRAYFTEQVEADLELRRHEAGESVAALMIIDIDDFKHVNDTMGHLVGDRLLGEASVRIREALSPRSLLARLGGDEFIVYLGGGASSAEGLAEAEAVLEAFNAPFDIVGEALSANVSVGVVASRETVDDLDAMMTKADLALYQAKGNGKAQLRVFHENMDTDYRYRQRLKVELRACVTAGGLTLAYQPLIDLASGRVVGCEALARWHHPQLGTIPPSLFIPIAEETGLISEISRWVLMTATRECRNWPPEVSVAVNISARDFRSGDVAGMVDAALKASGLAPHRLEIEVTETAVIEEREAATTILNALASQGIGIALDDFGTGYSSLSYLQALPFSKLKIDRSFVADLATNPRSLKLLTNVAQLGKDINLTVTAEGVETEEQLDLIRAHTKVDQIQGYLFGIPLPRREVGELIARMAMSPAYAERKRKRS